MSDTLQSWASLLSAVTNSSLIQSPQLLLQSHATDSPDRDTHDAKIELVSILFDAAKRDDVRPLEILTETAPAIFKQQLLEAENYKRHTLLVAACTSGSEAFAKCLIDDWNADVEQGVDDRINERPRQKPAKVRLLCYSAESCNVLIVRLLVERGAQLEVHDARTEHFSPLMLACTSGKLDTVKYLVEAGAHVDWTNGEGQTALMLASYCNTAKVVEYLLEARADTSKTCNRGRSALHYVLMKHVDLDLVKLLQKHGAPSGRDELGFTPAVLAASEGFDFDGSDAFSVTDTAEDYELLGCFLLRFHMHLTDREVELNTTLRLTKLTVSYWLRAQQMRKAANVQEPQYEAVCAQLVQVLRDFLGHLPPVTLLHADQNQTMLETYLQVNNWPVLYAHALIRCERILGAHHVSFIGRLTDYVKSFRNFGNLFPLVRYALSCSLSVQARKSSLVRPKAWYTRSASNCDLVQQLFPLLRLSHHVQVLLNGQEMHVDSHDLVGLLELCADQVQRTYVDRHSEDDFSVSVLFAGVVVLCHAVLRTFERTKLTTLQPPHPDVANSNSNGNCNSLLPQGSLELLERAVKRMCLRGLRGANNYSILHFAVLSNLSLYCHLAELCDPYVPSVTRRYHYYRRVICGRPYNSHFSNKQCPDCGTIEMLVRAGADCNARNCDGNTPVHLLADQLVHNVDQLRDSTPAATRWSVTLSDDSSDSGESLRRKLSYEAFDNHVQAAFCFNSFKLALANLVHVSDQHQLQPVVAFGYAITRTASEELATLDDLTTTTTVSHSHTSVNAQSHNHNSLGHEEEISEHLLASVASHVAVMRDNSPIIRHYIRLSASLRALLPFAHTDIRNAEGYAFWDILLGTETRLPLPLELYELVRQSKTFTVSSLQCLCARSVRTSKLQYRGFVPAVLADFVDFH